MVQVKSKSKSRHGTGCESGMDQHQKTEADGFLGVPISKAV